MARSPRKIHGELKNPAYEIFIGILSLLSIANLVLVYVYRDDTAMQVVLSVMNALFSVIFLGDFIYRMATAPAPWRYFFRGFGWADLLASLPFEQLKVLRIFRLLRVIRLMRSVGPRQLWAILIHDRANSTLMTLLLLGVFVMQFGSLAILSVEEYAKGANITTASDALWYTIVTISTVGYGDQYPVTTAGRIIGAVIIIVGVGIFGTFTGYLANLFLGPRQDKPDEDADADARRPEAAVGDPSGSASSDPAPNASPTTPTVGAGADATASGVAAGAVSGAVKAGMAGNAAVGAAVPAVSTPDETAVSERIEVLLAQSEAALAEIRQLLEAGEAS